MEFFNMLNTLNKPNIKSTHDCITRMTVDPIIVQKIIEKYDIRAMNSRKKNKNATQNATQNVNKNN